MEYKDIMIAIAKIQEMLHKGFVDYADGLLDELLDDLQSAQQGVQADKCHKSPSGEHQFNETIVASECVFCGTCR